MSETGKLEKDFSHLNKVNLIKEAFDKSLPEISRRRR